MKHRREFIKEITALTAAAYATLPRQSLANAGVVSNEKNRPNITHGIWSGDVSSSEAVICSRADRPSRMIVEVATNEQFTNAKKFHGPNVLANSDFTGKQLLSQLEAGKRWFYRVRFQDLNNLKRYSEPLIGQFKTASSDKQDIKFAWSGDTAGQGFGIDLARGGMKTYNTIRELNPDFFVNSGDIIYADNPFEPEKKLDDGTIWKNLVTEETSKVAETLDEFRANFRYNLLDEHVRRFQAAVPTFAQWDDHEVTNNWYPGEQLENDDRYRVKSASLLAARAKQAFFEYMPIRPSNNQQIVRKISYGPLLDLFFLDLRSFRGPNTLNRQANQGPETRFLGKWQLNWIKQALKNSTATWKVICSDMPIGMIVGDGGNAENCANGDGPALGRELEIAELLSFSKHNKVRNIVFLTADVHHATSHLYDPNLAQFSDFDPFWEFVSGPMHAGTFGPSRMDNTFGPQVKFCSIPDGMKANRPPSDGFQFFGLVNIDAETQSMMVEHYNRDGKVLSSTSIEPVL